MIAKALRTVPRNYTRPLPSPQIEFALRGTIYDPYVRRIMHEGILGKWRDEIPEWLSCPPTSTSASPSPDSPSGGGLWQQVMSLWLTRGVADQTDDEMMCPYHWAKPIHALNCELIWPKALDEPPYNQHRLSSTSDPCSDPEEEELESDVSGMGTPVPYLELDTPEYAGVISERWVVEKLLAMAGMRLAAVLNYLFAEGEGM